MASHAFKVTAKRKVGKIPAGSFVQVIKDQPGIPTSQHILKAYEQQLGITIKNVGISPSSNFTIEKL